MNTAAAFSLNDTTMIRKAESPKHLNKELPPMKKETFVICIDLLMELGIDRKTAEEMYEDILKKVIERDKKCSSGSEIKKSPL